jgi:hypothetical protein
MINEEPEMPLPARLRGTVAAALGSFVLVCANEATAETGRLSVVADGEALAIEGFLPPELTRDGWALRFSTILVTLANVRAYQTEPPYDPESGAPIEAVTSVTLVEGPLTVDLLATGGSGGVELATVEAPAGFYNALAWDLVRGADGASMILTGTATRDGETVDFRLTTSDAVRHRCGEYVGEARQGILEPGGVATLAATFHLDHLFGRADQPADGAMNKGALGFDPFASGGSHSFALEGLHLGHVGEGHCHVEAL